MSLKRGFLFVAIQALVFSLAATYLLNSYLQNVIMLIAMNIILAASLNLINGYCGQFSLGHAGFMAIGAYTSALLSLNFAPFEDAWAILNFPLYATAAGLAAALAGLLVGLPSLRLRGDYLAIVTLGFGEIIRVVLLNLDVVGGARGIYGLPGNTDLVAALHTWIWAGLTLLILHNLIQSTFGRAFLSVREDEIAAECMGIHVTRVKVSAFVISSFFAGVAGSLFAHINNSLNPASFQFIRSVDVVIMVVLGGMGSLWGSVLGAVIVTVLPEALRPLQKLSGVDLRMVLYSLCLILLMILRPQGLLGRRRAS